MNLFFTIISVPVPIIQFTSSHISSDSNEGARAAQGLVVTILASRSCSFFSLQKDVELQSPERKPLSGN